MSEKDRTQSRLCPFSLSTRGSKREREREKKKRERESQEERSKRGSE